MKKLFDEFKAFCSKGNILELATGVMIGGAFTAIVTSLVNDVLMPVIGLLTGGVNLKGLFLALDLQSYPSIAACETAGVGALKYGAFLQNVINFLIIAFCVFLLIKAMTKLMRQIKAEPPAAPARRCPYCKSVVDAQAVKCPYCTSDIEGK